MATGSTICARCRISPRSTSGRLRIRLSALSNPANCFSSNCTRPAILSWAEACLRTRQSCHALSRGRRSGRRTAPRRYGKMRARIARYTKRSADDRTDFRIDCRILTQPFFLPQYAWIPTDDMWSRQTVSFKTYATDEADGMSCHSLARTLMDQTGSCAGGRWRGLFQERLWDKVQDATTAPDSLGFADRAPRYGEPALIRPRLGQGAFRVVVTDNYHRRCAVTRERTLPALEAAHIMPFAEGGEHEASNGVLLRRDIHSLFDAGYVTITPTLKFEVSRRIKEEFENGRQYYKLV